MPMLDKKADKTYKCYPHCPGLTDDNKAYCRAVNDVVLFDTDRCEYCPLCDKDNGDIRCCYYDYVTEDEKCRLYQLKEKTDELIEKKMVDNFPDFVDGKRWGREYLQYEKALQFAAEAHKNAKRKGSLMPYIIHPVEVSMIAMELTDDMDIIVASVLHDVVEDTSYELSDIEKIFGSRVAELVGYESENKRRDRKPEDTWKVRKEEAIEHIKSAPIGAKIITLSDKLSNMRATKKDYEKLGDKSWEKFNQRDKKLQEWYYSTMLYNLQELKETKPWKELESIISEVFADEE